MSPDHGTAHPDAPAQAPGALDLTACDREMVQYPGAIMPHGLLFVLSPGDHRVLGASANAVARFGSAGTLAGARLERLVEAVALPLVEHGLAQLGEPAPPVYLGCFRTPWSRERFDLFAHRSGESVLLEFETAGDDDAAGLSPAARFAAVTQAIVTVQAAETWQAGMDVAARELKRLTGFDSVVANRFLEDGSFQSLAQAREPHFMDLLDKRFPRSDIPEPGRRQMLLMPLQYAPDLDYEPVPLLSFDLRLDPAAIDLGYARLRSLSRSCNRFYLNMGVRSRLVVSLAPRGRLWGFFACMSVGPRHLSHADRLAALSFAETAALLLAEKEAAARHRDALEAKRRIAGIVRELSSATPLAGALCRLPARLMEAIDLAGAALCGQRAVIRAGNAPPAAMIEALIAWLDAQDACYVTDRLPLAYGPAAEHADRAAGLIAVRLLESGEYLLGFRPEWVHEVTWAGDPRKPVAADATNGELRLTARGSFEAWKETVRGSARPWCDHEREALADLQRELIPLQQAEKLRDLTVRLERTNTELEAFAYTASHDLREPLRGIRNFSQFLRDSAAERLTFEEHAWLNTIMKLSLRMSRQIEALLDYARAGQQPAALRPTDLNRLLSAVLESLSARIAETGARVDVPRPLPSVACDPVGTSAVFENLIANGIKYNDQAEKRVEVGYLDGAPPTFFVRDNGIGIPEAQRDEVFMIFRRLHPRDAYGGGTGAGLSIARKQVEHQGGKIWLESAPGQGSTFYFTLAPAAGDTGSDA